MRKPASRSSSGTAGRPTTASDGHSSLGSTSPAGPRRGTERCGSSATRKMSSMAPNRTRPASWRRHVCRGPLLAVHGRQSFTSTTSSTTSGGRPPRTIRLLPRNSEPMEYVSCRRCCLTSPSTCWHPEHRRTPSRASSAPCSTSCSPRTRRTSPSPRLSSPT